MAILTSFRIPGDPHDLLARSSKGDPQKLGRVAPQNGNLARVIVDEGDGLRFFDLWETEDGMRRAADRTRPVARAQGLPAAQEWRQWDVVHHQLGRPGASPDHTERKGRNS